MLAQAVLKLGYETYRFDMHIFKLLYKNISVVSRLYLFLLGHMTLETREKLCVNVYQSNVYEMMPRCQ